MTTTPLRIKDLKPNPQNPRRITDAKRRQLAKTLAYYGDLGGIVFNRTTGQLVGGHQRLSTFDRDAQVTITEAYDTPTKAGTVALGHATIDGERFAYREVQWDVVVEKAANLAANKGAGEFDLHQVNAWLTELDAQAFDLDMTLFDADERAALHGQGDGIAQLAAQIVDERAAEAPKIPKTRLGDVYQLGRHRLMCGNCANPMAVQMLLDKTVCDITFTSPPYNAAKNGHIKGRVEGFDVKYNNSDDAMSDEDYLALLTDFTALCLESSRYVFVNLQLLTHNRVPILEYQSKYIKYVKDILIWNKSQCPPNIVKGAFNTKWEYIFCFSKDVKTRGFPCSWQGQHPNVVVTNANGNNEYADDHKAGFPILLPAWFLERLTFVDTIYDPFCGTGTTLVCAEQMGKTCFGMELDPGYCDVICDRWERLTGQRAQLIGNGTDAGDIYA